MFDSEFSANDTVYFTSCTRRNLRFALSIANSYFGTESILQALSFFDREDWVSVRVGWIKVKNVCDVVPVKFWMKWGPETWLAGLTIDFMALEKCRCI